MAQSKILEILPENYGYVVFVAVDSIFVNMWMAMNVGRARKELGVKVSHQNLLSSDVAFEYCSNL